MIVPKTNQKAYGVVHTKNYFSFLGFCKNVNDTETQNIDIYIDDELVDTIIANESIQKIDDIYDIKGFGFTYDLEEKYLDSKSIISFKNNITQDHLKNSPYKLIGENNKNFTEVKFLHSLYQSKKKEKTNDIDFPSCIGFFVKEENMQDKVFTKFIHELSERFPNNTIIGYGFNDHKEKLLKKEFSERNIVFNILEDSNQLSKDINIWIESAYTSKDKLFNYLVYDSKNTYCLNIENNIEDSLKTLISIKKYKEHLFIKYPNLFNLKSDGNNLFEMLCNEMNIAYDGDMSHKDFLFQLIKYSLTNNKANKIYTKRVNVLRNFAKNRI